MRQIWNSPQTGRTHQIRVHLAHIGHPIVGAPAYGGRRRVPGGAHPELIAALDSFGRQALHAARLRLKHPLTEGEVEWQAPLPEDMQHLISALETDLAFQLPSEVRPQASCCGRAKDTESRPTVTCAGRGV